MFPTTDYAVEWVPDSLEDRKEKAARERTPWAQRSYAHKNLSKTLIPRDQKGYLYMTVYSSVNILCL